MPDLRVTGAPHGATVISSWSSAAAVEPDTDTGTGLASTSTSPRRQPLVKVAGVVAGGTPGSAIVAMPTGSCVGLPEMWSVVSSDASVGNVNLKVVPVRGAKERWTVETAPWVAPAGAGGTTIGTVTCWPRSVDTVTEVGTLWRWSSSTWSVADEMVVAEESVADSHGGSGAVKAEIHDDAGSASKADHDPALRSPASRELLDVETMRSPDPCPLPSNASSWLSEMSVEIADVPETLKVRADGSVKVRDIASSGSVRGGIVAARSRCMRMSSGSRSPAVPAPASRSVGIRSVEVTGPTPGTETSANPTPL